jgi:hypothetical protein
VAQKRWTGASASVAQQNTVTPANVGVGNTFTVTTNGKSITFVATAATVGNVTAGLFAAISASQEPEWRQLAATDNLTNLLITGPDDGTPFTQTSSATGGTASLTTATATASVSPNEYANANNWSPSGVPVAADDVIAAGTNLPAIKWGLNQSGVAVSSFYTKGVEIGLPEWNPLGYSEYRGTHLQLSVTGNITVDGDSGRVKLDAGSSQATLNVNGSGTPLESGVPAVQFRGTHPSNAVRVTGGSVGLGFIAGSSCVVAALTVGEGSGGQAPQVVGGTNLSLTNLTQLGGTVELNATINVAVGTVTKAGGTLTVNGTGTGGTIYNDGGDLAWNAGNITTTVNTSDGGFTDFTRSAKSRTVAGCVLNAGAKLAFDINTTTFTGTPNIVLNRCSFEDVTISTGNHLALSIAAGP